MHPDPKSVDRFHPKKCPKAKLTINNISYIASKAYPTMITVASRKDKSVRFAWLGDLIGLEELMDILKPNQKRKSVLLRLDPYRELNDDVEGIVQQVSIVKSRIGFWYQKEENRRVMSDLYFDIHAALDALLEIGCKSRVREFSDDEWSHKLTYTFSLVVSVYFLLHSIQRSYIDNVADPASGALVAIISRLRVLVLNIVPEEYLVQHESGETNQEGDIMVLPGSPTRLLGQADQFICAFRDILRELSRFVAPSRDFSLRCSGLASSIIEFEARPTD